jgi:hypothetical protein
VTCSSTLRRLAPVRSGHTTSVMSSIRIGVTTSPFRRGGPMTSIWLAVVLISLVGTSACGTNRQFTLNDAPHLDALFRQRMNADNELQGDVRQVRQVVLRDRGLESIVVIDGRAWSDKSRTQQERLVRKSTHMQAALYEAQPDPAPEHVHRAAP